MTAQVNKLWTQEGIKRLGVIIASSRESAGLSLRQVAQIIQRKTGINISYRTIDKVETGDGMPQFNTLVAIAASRIVVNRDGTPLTIYDFIDIASQSVIRGIEMETLIYLIEQTQKRTGFTPKELAEECGVGYVNLLQIMQGRETEDFEGDLFALSAVLINPQTGVKFDYVEDLTEFCQIKIPDQELDRESHLNGNGFLLC